MVPVMLRGANPTSTKGLTLDTGSLYLTKIGNSQELALSLDDGAGEVAVFDHVAVPMVERVKLNRARREACPTSSV